MIKSMWKRLSKPWKRTIVIIIFFLLANLIMYLLNSFYIFSWSLPISDIQFREKTLGVEGFLLSTMMIILFFVWLFNLED